MSTKKFLKLISSIVVALIATIGFSTSAAYAASPHYIKGPTATVGDNSLTVSWKAAGLGNTTEFADFSLEGTVTATAQCFTKSGNPVNGVPKTDTTHVDTTESFPVRNGQVTGSITVEPLTTLTCTGKQVVRILDVSYDLTLYGEGLPPVHLVG